MKFAVPYKTFFHACRVELLYCANSMIGHSPFLFIIFMIIETRCYLMFRIFAWTSSFTFLISSFLHQRERTTAQGLPDASRIMSSPGRWRFCRSELACGTGPATPGGRAAESPAAAARLATACRTRPWTNSPPGPTAPAGWTTGLCLGRPRRG